MSFGWSAAAWTAIGVGTAAASSAYSTDQQRKAVHGQRDALLASQEADARQAAEAETSAATAANAKLADNKRRRQASALGAGDPNAGAPVISAGATTQQKAATYSAPAGASVLGGGAIPAGRRI
jgi:hypothetical protein